MGRTLDIQVRPEVIKGIQLQTPLQKGCVPDSTLDNNSPPENNIAKENRFKGSKENTRKTKPVDVSYSPRTIKFVLGSLNMTGTFLKVKLKVEGQKSKV